MARVIAKGIQSADKILGQHSTQDTKEKELSGSGIIMQESSRSTSSKNIQLRSVWKVRGDLCTLARNLAPADVTFLLQLSQIIPKNVPGNVLENVLENVPGNNNDDVTFSGLGTGGSLPSYAPLLQILKEGEYAYRKVLEIAEDSGSMATSSFQACFLRRIPLRSSASNAVF